MLMGTQLINPKYFIQGIIWPSSAHLLFSSPYCPQIQTVPSIHLKGGYKSRLKTTKKSKTLASQDRRVTHRTLLFSTATAVSHQPPAVSQHRSITTHGLSQGMGPALPPAQQGTMVMISYTEQSTLPYQQCIVHPPSRECTENTTRAWFHLVCSCWRLQKCFLYKQEYWPTKGLQITASKLKLMVFMVGRK